MSGPDNRHPFVIRGLRVWDAHWAVALAAPGVLIDGLDIAHCDFGLWRPHYERHAYRNLNVYQTTWAFYAETGTRPDPSAFPAPLDPIDDRPPVTVMTCVGPLRDGRLVVRGVTADDGTIRAVRVNGQAARAAGAQLFPVGSRARPSSRQFPFMESRRHRRRRRRQRRTNPAPDRDCRAMIEPTASSQSSGIRRARQPVP